MAVSGVRARNFIRGGTASSVFAAKRGVSVARPARAAEKDPQSGSRFGKASGSDYVNFFSGKRNTKAIRSAVLNMKNMLVEGFTAAKELQSSVGNIVGQLKGLGGGGGGGGKKFGLFGIVAALAIAVGAFFAPQLKKAFDYVLGLGKNIFKTVRAALRKVDETIQTIYKGVQNFVDGIRNWISSVNERIAVINSFIKLTPFGEIPEVPNIQENLLPDYNGLDFLKEEYGMKELKSDVGSAFGGVNDMFQGMFNSLFGKPSKQKTSEPESPAVSEPSARSQNTSGSGYQAGRVPAAVANDTSFQQGVTDLAKKYDLSEDDLYAVMSFETGGTFDPAQKNLAGSEATGLIQFMPETARGLGTTTDELAAMSRTEQLKYVDKHFSNKGIKGANLDDLYMSILFPAAVGKPDDFVLFGKGAMSGYRGTAYDQNRGLDANNDGLITKAEASAKVREHKLEPVTSNPSVSRRGPSVNLLNVPGPQVAQAPPRPQRLVSTNSPDGSGSGPTVAFYSSSNSDSFDHISAKAAYSLVG